MKPLTLIRVAVVVAVTAAFWWAFSSHPAAEPSGTQDDCSCGYVTLDPQ